METKLIRFVCPFCDARRKQSVDYILHKERLIKQSNGLLTYSDLHSCENGILKLIDIKVDNDLNVRSVEKFNLMKSNIISGNKLPLPIVKSNTSRSVDNFELHRFKQRFRIKSEIFNFDIQFGQIPDEMNLNEIISSTEDVILQYTGQSHEVLDLWFQELVDIIEFSPPNELGILLEAFQYIFDVFPNEPTPFDKEIIKTMFVSHEVFVIPLMEDDENFSEILNEHGIEPEIARQIQNISIQFNDTSILQLTKITKSLTKTIYYAMLLEKQSMIELHRPGILETPFYLQEIYQ